MTWARTTILAAIMNLAIVVAGTAIAFNLVGLLTPKWAAFYNVTADWIGGDEPHLHIAFQLDKTMECQEVQVRKTLSRVVQEGDVVPVSTVWLNGQLPSKLRDAPLGTSPQSDDSKPRGPVPPGEYQLSMLASCMPLQASGSNEAPVLRDADVLRVNVTVEPPGAMPSRRSTAPIKTGYLLE